MKKNDRVPAARIALALGALVLLELAGPLVRAVPGGEMTGVSAAQAQTAAPSSPDELPKKDKAEAAREKIEKGGLDLEIIRDVEKRQKELEEKEKELNRREERLKAMQADLDRQISELKAVQAKIDEQIKLRGDLQKEAVVKLAKTYASMPPENAARLIQKIDTSIAIRVLSVMKERAAGKILAAAPPELASKLSEGLVKKR